MRFVQTMTLRASDGMALADLVSAWHEAEAGVAPGYLGSRLLADRDDPGRFILSVDFSSYEEAELNNERPETRAWAERMGHIVDGEAAFGNFDEVRRVG